MSSARFKVVVALFVGLFGVGHLYGVETGLDPGKLSFVAEYRRGYFTRAGVIRVIYDGRELERLPYHAFFPSDRDTITKILNLRALSLKRLSHFLSPGTIQLDIERLRAALASGFALTEGDFTRGCAFNRLVRSPIMKEEQGTSFRSWRGYWGPGEQEGFTLARREINVTRFAHFVVANVAGIGELTLPGAWGAPPLGQGLSVIRNAHPEELIQITPGCRDRYPKPLEFVDIPIWVRSPFIYNSAVPRPLRIIE